MHIAIPSKGRAGNVKSGVRVPSATVYCPESEAEQYRELGTNAVIGVPGEVMGITATRNWILDNNDDPWVVMIDDDLNSAGWRELLDTKTRNSEMKEKCLLNEWGKLFAVTEQMGYRIWGVKTEKAPRSLYPCKPFLWRTYITASCMGILNDGRTRFDESFPVKEDYELCLRCIKEDGGIVGARYMHWENTHWRDEGGCKVYRTQLMEMECIRRLRKMYPGMIRQIVRNGCEYSIELEF